MIGGHDLKGEYGIRTGLWHDGGLLHESVK